MIHDLGAEPQTTGDINALHTPSRAPTFKQQCDDLIAFCHHAHQLSAESAYRCRIPSELFEELSLTPRASTSTITELPTDSRRELLARVSTAINTAAPEHTGAFPDFIGYANSIRQRFDRYITQGLDPIADTSPSDEVGDPAAIARAFIQTLSVTLATAQHIEQKQNALVLLSALRAATKNSLPDVSLEAQEAQAQVFQNETDSTLPYSLRR